MGFEMKNGMKELVNVFIDIVEEIEIAPKLHKRFQKLQKENEGLKEQLKVMFNLPVSRKCTKCGTVIKCI